MIAGKNAMTDKNATINGASILIRVMFRNINHEIVFVIVIKNPKKINKLKL
jgi:hypothetical protein